MKKSVNCFLISFCLIFSLVIPASAETMSSEITVTNADGTTLTKLTDGNESTVQTCAAGELHIRSTGDIGALYIVFDDFCPDWGIVTPSGKQSLSKNQFLHAFADTASILGGTQKEVTLYFSRETKICDIYAFTDTNVPDWVQIWQPPCEKADLLLLSSHADDEQLFFAGILPYYAGERQLAVQVAYFTNHNNQPKRRHEQLNGLWTVGVRHYPIIGDLPDLYAESKQTALQNWQKYGFAEQDIVGSQVALLRRFRPQVVIEHDINGEYGHGAHILNTDTLLQALAVSKNAQSFPQSAEQYGTHTPKKVYIHLYEKNPVIMNWDIPLARFGGKTAYEVSCEGFACHASQHWTWFKKWLLGTDTKPITKATDISTYSPCRYGLYFTEVGADTEGNDFFENITPYAEQERQAQAEKERLLQEQQKQAEQAEQKQAESEQTPMRAWWLWVAAPIVLILSAVCGNWIYKKRRLP